MDVRAEPVGNAGLHGRHRQYQAIERSWGRFGTTAIAYGPARLFTRGRLHGLAFAHGFGARIDDDGLRLYGLLVEIDLETQGGKSLAGLGDGFAVGKQAQHAQVEFAIDRFAPALLVAPLETGF